MQVSWYLYRWDHERYLALRPILRAARTFADLAACRRYAETDEEEEGVAEILDAFEAEEITLPEARQTLVRELCCVAVLMPLERSVGTFIATLGRQKGAEEVGEQLGVLLAGGKNLEPWLLPVVGLIGFLTPEQTVALRDHYKPLAARGRLRGKKGARRRQGGLLGAVEIFFRTLLDLRPRPEEILRLLAGALGEAVTEGQGIAVVKIRE